MHQQKLEGLLIIAERKLQLVVIDSGNDSDGRFVYALLSVNYAKLLLACIYAPNVFNDDFCPPSAQRCYVTRLPIALLPVILMLQSLQTLTDLWAHRIQSLPHP